MSTYFKFDGQLYQQLKGTPMGSPISGFIAEVVMQKLEQLVLPTIKPKLWIRYVDDTFVIMKRNAIQEAYDKLNNTFEDIKFTMELEKNNTLPFLDVLVTRNTDGTLQTCVYRKKTHRDQILHYHSNHPMNHKKSCIQTLFRRAETHCSTDEAKRKEENYLFRIFQNNGYPRNFIRRSKKKRTSRQQEQQQQQPQTNNRVVLPYVKNVSELTARLLQTHGITTAHKPNATLRKLISKPKDRTDGNNKNNVIYQIDCENCNKYYIGQTGRKLSTRIKEHKAAIRRHDPLSLISIHEDQEGHKFNLETVRILARGNTRHAREFLEAWHSTTNSINRHIELDPIYAPILAKDLQRNGQTTRGPRPATPQQQRTVEPRRQRSQSGTHGGQVQRSTRLRSTGGQQGQQSNMIA
jgi:hypothetical protein